MSDRSRWPSQTAEASARRRREIAYGRWQPYVDAEPARRHVLKLREAGMGPVTISRVSGVPHGSLAKLIYGDRQRGLAPSKRIRPETEAKILAVQPTLDQLGDGARVPAFGTQRRIQALHAIGWTLAEVARRVGVTRQHIDRLLEHSYVQARTATAVDCVYRDLCMTPGPSDAARRRAAARDWKPPMWWDDIDAPKDRGVRADVPPPPYAKTRRPTYAPPADADVRRRLDALTVAEAEVLRHLALGETPERVATLRICSVDTVRHQIKGIVAKLDVTGYPAAIAAAWRAGWIRLDRRLDTQLDTEGAA